MDGWHKRGGKNEKALNCYGYLFIPHVYNQTGFDGLSNYLTWTPQVDSTTYRITDDESVWKNVGTGTNPDGTQANLGVYGGKYSWEN